MEIKAKPNYDESGPVKQKDTRKGTKPEIVVEMDSKKGQMFIHFKYDERWKNEIKKLDGAWWHTEAKIWSVLLSEYNLKKIKQIFTNDNSQLVIKEDEKSKNKKQVQKKYKDRTIVNHNFVKQLKLENKSPNTIESYLSQVTHFLHAFKETDLANLSEQKISEYILYNREELGYSASYQRIMISAINNYYRIVFNRELDRKLIPYPKFGIQLPKVISKEDVQKMLTLTTNYKHKMIIIMLYSLGLRNGELAKLKLGDIDFDRGIVSIYNAKGMKDRQLPLPKSIIAVVQRYIRDFAIRDNFLEGQKGNTYSSGSIDIVVRKAASRAKVKFNVTPHILRHCFATHSLEKGVDLRYIQAMLGHKSSKTTEIYTYVSTKQLKNLSNPFDDIEL